MFLSTLIILKFHRYKSFFFLIQQIFTQNFEYKLNFNICRKFAFFLIKNYSDREHCSIDVHIYQYIFNSSNF
jgi:hypothetical protein